MASFDCKDVHQRIVEGGPLDDASVRAHVEGCPACAELVAAGAVLGAALAAEASSELPSADAIEDATMRQVEAAPGFAGRIRELATPWRAMVFAVGALIGVAIVLATSMRVDMAVFPTARLVINLGVLGALVLWGGALLLRPLHRPPPKAWMRNLLPWAAVLAPFVLAALPAAHEAHAASLEGTGDDLVRRAAACFMYGSAFSIPIAVVAWLTERSAFRASGTVTFALLAAAAVGNIVLVLHCPLTAPVHRLGGHATIAVAFFAVALVLARVIWRRDARRTD
jgi:hypothetical protein